MAMIYSDMHRKTGKNHLNESADRKLVNINTPERIFSVMAGTFFFYSGIKGLFRNPVSAASKLLAGAYLFNRGASGHCYIYEKTGTDGVKPLSINIRQNFIVNRPREEVYQFWRNIENLPLFMKHLVSVEAKDNIHSHWKASFGSYLPTVSWDAEIVKERQNEFIGWSALEGSIIENAGKIEFKDSPDGGTAIQVVFTYHAPVGGIASGIAKLFNPTIERIIHDDVYNFKTYIETGSIPSANEAINGAKPLQSA